MVWIAMIGLIKFGDSRWVSGGMVDQSTVVDGGLLRKVNEVDGTSSLPPKLHRYPDFDKLLSKHFHAYKREQSNQHVPALVKTTLRT